MRTIIAASVMSLMAYPAFSDSSDPIKLTLHDWSASFIPP